MKSKLGLLLLLSTTQCSWCAAPKPLPDDDLADPDAAPAALEGKPRCESHGKIALPGALEIGRAERAGSRVIAGARRGDRVGLLEIDGLTARFVETGAASGDAPPPLPVLLDATKQAALAYEGNGAKRHLVLRDAGSAHDAIVSLDPEPPDESLAYDAAVRSDGSIAIAWDAPADSGPAQGAGPSAVFATVVRGGKAGPVVRISPADVDADTPRLVALGPTILAFWIAHRALPKTDAAALPEGPGQDLDHAWVEMLAVGDDLQPTAPLRHLTPDTGRVTFFGVEPRGADPSARSAGPGMTVDVVARDGIELQAGQGGTALLVHVAGPDVPVPIVVADHVGRGLPLVVAGIRGRRGCAPPRSRFHALRRRRRPRSRVVRRRPQPRADPRLRAPARRARRRRRARRDPWKRRAVRHPLQKLIALYT